jgi:hypothetical protein
VSGECEEVGDSLSGVSERSVVVFRGLWEETALRVHDSPRGHFWSTAWVFCSDLAQKGSLESVEAGLAPPEAPRAGRAR